MTNATLRANAPALPSDRRAFLRGALTAGALAVTAVPTLADAGGDPDPVLAIIRAHRLSHAAFEDACNLTDEVRAKLEGRQITEADEAVYERCCDREAADLDALVSTPPTTALGARAVIERLIEISHGPWEQSPREAFLETLLNSPLLAEAANV